MSLSVGLVEFLSAKLNRDQLTMGFSVTYCRSMYPIIDDLNSTIIRKIYSGIIKIQICHSSSFQRANLLLFFSALVEVFLDVFVLLLYFLIRLPSGL